MTLSKRESSVLMWIVELYIRTGAPVASRQVVSSSDLGLSPATIRNVMADLEERGLVSRTHLSAGCIPTDRSFRAYVDTILPGRRLPSGVRRTLAERIDSIRCDLAEGIVWLAELVAEATSEAGVAVWPMEEEPVLGAVALVQMGRRRVLGVLVTADGGVEKRVIELTRDCNDTELRKLAASLNCRYAGQPLAAIREELDAAKASQDQADAGNHEPLDHPELAALASQLFALDGSDVDVEVAGADNLLGTTDFAEAERIASLMAALQDRGRLAQEWRRVLGRGRTQVIIGQESEVTASGSLAMVATMLSREGRRIGALGVVGPRRMNYCRIVPVLEFIGDTLTKTPGEPGYA